MTMKTPDQAAHDAAREAGEAGFAGLLAELETLSKALPAVDDEGHDDDAAAEAAADEDEAELSAAGAEDGEEPFGKSFTVTLEDGTEAEAFDGTAMLKALHDENVALRSQGEDMAKALTGLGGLVKGLHAALSEQAEMLKSLRGEVRKLGAQGNGRRTTLSLHEKPSPVEPKREGLSVGEVFAKAESLIGAGKLNALQAGKLTASLNSGRGIPTDLAPLFADAAG